MTATASNIAYGWWSHDIGGHMGGVTEPELYARWVQFGALSPCLRLHATKDARFERRPWAYPDEAYHAARAAFHLRYQLVPYLYTMARVASDSGVSLCRPMYYEHPEVEDAYAARYQYYLGDQAIAAPIVFPAEPATGMAATDVWVPRGTWIDIQTLETYTGPRWARMVGDINRVPLLVKAGGILPMAAEFAEGEPPRLASGTTGDQPRDWLVLSVFPGPDGVYRLYEDDPRKGAARRCPPNEGTTFCCRAVSSPRWS
jgi:alpha-glucosidase